MYIDIRNSSIPKGFMTNQEKELFQAVPCNEFNTYWIPCTWFVFRIQEAAKKKKLLNEYAIETIMRVRMFSIFLHYLLVHLPTIFSLCLSSIDLGNIIYLQEFCEFRSRCGLLWCYDWVSIPMVYTQVIIYTNEYTKANII